MKKFFLNLFVVSALILSVSCSGDDDSNGDEVDDQNQELIVTIDGTTKVFELITVDNSDVNLIQIEARFNDNTSEKIDITAAKEETGTLAITNCSYQKPNGGFFNSLASGSSFNSNTTVNTETTFIATFSGTFNSSSDSSMVILEAGSINVMF